MKTNPIVREAMKMNWMLQFMKCFFTCGFVFCAISIGVFTYAAPNDHKVEYYYIKMLLCAIGMTLAWGMDRKK